VNFVKENVEKEIKRIGENRNRFLSLFHSNSNRKGNRFRDGEILAGFLFFSCSFAESTTAAVLWWQSNPLGAAPSSCCSVVGRCSIVVDFDKGKEEALRARLFVVVLHEELFELCVVVFICCCCCKIDSARRLGGLFNRVRGECVETCRRERIENRSKSFFSLAISRYKKKLNAASPRPRSTATGEIGPEAWTTLLRARKCEQVREKKKKKIFFSNFSTTTLASTSTSFSQQQKTSTQPRSSTRLPSSQLPTGRSTGPIPPRTRPSSPLTCVLSQRLA